MGTGLFGDLLVIDCASFVAGPAAATIMSDFGARVIKIEPPGEGDAYRTLIKYRGAEDVIDYFWTLDSRNKESVALDLKSPDARAFLDELIKRADVFITNYPFPVRERLRLQAKDVMPLNKRLIYASLSPYGEEGPERDRTAFDATAWWARSGLMDMVRATGDTELAMSVPGMGDHPTATAMYAAIVTALYRRQVTGEGAEVTTSLLANGLWSNGCQVQAALCDLELVPRAERGQRNPLVEYYLTADGREFTLAMVNIAREWPLLLRAIGRTEWLEDPLFSTPLARFENGDLLTTLLGDTFGGETLGALEGAPDRGRHHLRPRRAHHRPPERSAAGGERPPARVRRRHGPEDPGQPVHDQGRAEGPAPDGARRRPAHPSDHGGIRRPDRRVGCLGRPGVVITAPGASAPDQTFMAPRLVLMA